MNNEIFKSKKVVEDCLNKKSSVATKTQGIRFLIYTFIHSVLMAHCRNEIQNLLDYCTLSSLYKARPTTTRQNLSNPSYFIPIAFVPLRYTKYTHFCLRSYPHIVTHIRTHVSLVRDDQSSEMATRQLAMQPLGKPHQMFPGLRLSKRCFASREKGRCTAASRPLAKRTHVHETTLHFLPRRSFFCEFNFCFPKLHKMAFLSRLKSIPDIFRFTFTYLLIIVILHFCQKGCLADQWVSASSIKYASVDFTRKNYHQITCLHLIPTSFLTMNNNKD